MAGVSAEEMTARLRGKDPAAKAEAKKFRQAAQVLPPRDGDSHKTRWVRIDQITMDDVVASAIPRDQLSCG